MEESYLATLVQADRTLDDIDQALKRLDEGTYQVCETCGENIDEGLLTQYPTSRTCERHLDLDGKLSSKKFD